MPALFRLTLPIALILSLGACATSPQSGDSFDGLELRQVRGLDEVWVRPGADFSSYQSLVVKPVEVAFDPHWDPRRPGTRLRLRDDEREQIRTDTAALFDQTFRRELERSGRFELVDTPTGNSLIVEPKIIDLSISAPDTRSTASTMRVFVTEFGRVTLVAELMDPESGAIVARINDRQIARATHPMEFADRFTNEREGERIFSRWARTLVEQLDRLD